LQKPKVFDINEIVIQKTNCYYG